MFRTFTVMDQGTERVNRPPRRALRNAAPAAYIGSTVRSSLLRSGIRFATGAVAGVACVVQGYAVARAVLASARARREQDGDAPAPATKDPRAPRPHVVLVRPCAGAEPSLHEALRSIAEALPFGDDCTLETLCALTDERDAAAPVAEAACATLRARGFDARVVYTAAGGPNHKAQQLAAALAQATRPATLVAVADSDVALAGYSFAALLRPLLASAREAGSRPVGAVWAPPFEDGRSTAGDRASTAVLTASLQSFGVLAALDPRGFVGKLFAVRADALAACGGFEALGAHLGEDVELARRLRARGYRVAVGPAVRALASGRHPRATVERFARWMQVVRAQRGALLGTYPLLFFPTLTVSALALVAAPAAPGLALASVASTAWLRVALARHAAARLGLRRSRSEALRDAARAELTLVASFVVALRRGRHVLWRGRALRFDHAGVLHETDAAPRSENAPPRATKRTELDPAPVPSAVAAR